MKALTLWQPWASLIALGHKTIETRGWATRFRGPIAIHAAKRFGRTEQLMCDTWPFNQVLKAKQKFPLGAIVATATLTDCIQIGVDTGSERYQAFEAQLEEHPYEREFGDYVVERWAWRLQDVTPRLTAVRVRGAQGQPSQHGHLSANSLAVETCLPFSYGVRSGGFFLGPRGCF